MAKRTRSMMRVERREQLLQIARDLVAKEGIGALTMMALSDRAKVAKPVVYSHFPNREAVAIALLHEHFKALIEFVRDRTQNATTLDDYLSRLIDASFEFESNSETAVRKITNGFSAGDEVNQTFLRYEETFRGHWEQLLNHFGLRGKKAEVAAYVLWGMMNNTVYIYSITPQQKVARETLKEMLLAAIHAVAPVGGRERRSMPVIVQELPFEDEAEQTARPSATVRSFTGRPKAKKRARALG